MRSHSTSQSFSKHLRQADLSRLAPRVVTHRVLVALSGSFTSKNRYGADTNACSSRRPALSMGGDGTNSADVRLDGEQGSGFGRSRRVM